MIVDRDRTAALLPDRALHPALVAKLVRAGRIRDAGWSTWRAMREAPMRADGILREALRSARALHSRERRAVADLLHDLTRVHAALPPFHGGAADPAAADWWLLAVHHGVPVETAAAAWAEDVGGPMPALEVATDLPAAWAARWQSGSIEALAEAAGVPEAIAHGLWDGLGASVWDLLAASAGRAPVSVRVDRRHLTRDEAVRRLQDAGVAAEPSAVSPVGVRLPPRTNLDALPRALRTALEPQDDASQVVAELVPEGAGRVLDLCAGAGGKTLALGARLPEASLWATDVRRRALTTLEDRARRSRVRVRTGLWRDGTIDRDLGGLFDAVVVDAPCTGTGVWRRHPAWRMRLEDGPPTAVQDQVLDRAVSWVKPGGVIVYATCSVLPVEDEARVDAVCARHPGLSVVPIAEAAPHLSPAIHAGPYLRTLPHEHGTDGFFGAVLRRG